MSEEKRKDYEPLALGSFDAYPDRIAASIGIPSDALPPILQMLIAKEFARLHSLRLEMKLTEDDMPPATQA
jgi:hypothetical protein